MIQLVIFTFLFLVSNFSKAHVYPNFICSTDLQTIFENEDPILFTVNGKAVHLSEFKYIYAKTNGDKADFSEKSLNEYLQLYIDFKLQVAKGIDMGLDKNAEVIREQNQYKKQLSSTYLTDREITEKLVKEAFEWSKEDRKISHILVALSENASAEEVKEALLDITDIKNRASSDNFAELAKQQSNDTYSKEKGGDLGFFTILQLPYEMEKAMYGTALQSISPIFRTKYGFHILKVTEIRPAKGQIQLAHILARGEESVAKSKIDSIYNILKAADSFETLATSLSEDNSTKSRGGIIGWVGINKFPAEFEKAIFDLSKDGAISAPVKSSAGWHILKRIKSMKNPSYQESKGELTNKIKQNERYQIVQDSLTSKIKKEAGYYLDENMMKELIKILESDANFLQGRWNPSNELLADDRTLFSVGDKKGSIKEFALMAQRSPNERFALSPRTTEAAIKRVLEKVVAQKSLEYEEGQLDKKYPEFKSLMREYEEGILLFEVKKQLIWDKASSDEEGLKKFFDANKSKYKWKDRAKVTFYTVKSTDEKLIKSIKKFAQKNSSDAVKSNFNKENALVQTTEASYEKGKNKEIDDLKWKAGSCNQGYVKDGSSFFTKIESITPSTEKKLEEARGYVVADYQDELEKQLLKSLRESYKVEINQDVLKSLIKK